MSENMVRPVPYTVYRHFKGNLYQVICVATHSESGEEMVVYQALYGDYKIYARPLEMFMSPVDHEKYPDASQRLRFEPVNINQNEALATAAQNLVDIMTPAETSDYTDSIFRKTETKTEETKTAEKPEVSDDEPQIDSDVLEFLDANTYEKRLEILGRLRYKITNDMIDIMSTVIDIDVPEGNPMDRYESFKEALLTRRHYECNRFRG